jgi:exopolysaccharide production protein ExoQ
LQQIATLLFVVLIAGLFWLDRDRNAHTSKALWIPVAWLMIAGSRNIGEWVQLLSAGPSRVGGDDNYLEGNPIDRNVLGTLIVLALIALFMRRRQIAALIRSNSLVFLYLGYCGMSILWSDYPAVGFRRWFRALGDFMMVMVVLTEFDRSVALKRFLTRTGFLLVPLSVLFIRWYPDLGRSYGGDGTPYWGGVTGGKNSLGMICLIFGLASLWRFVSAYRDKTSPLRKRFLIAEGIFLVLVIYLLHEAHSATSLACFILAGTVLVLTSRSGLAGRPKTVHLLVAGVVALAVIALFFDPTGSMVSTLGRNSTLTGRTDVWARATTIVENPLLGSGFETFWLGNRLEYMRRLDPGLNQSHNGYIELYLNLGWVGIVIVGTMMIKGYRGIVAGLRHLGSVNSLMLAYFVVGVIYNCTESGFKMMSPVWIVTLMAILPASVAVASSKKNAPALAQQVGPRVVNHEVSQSSLLLQD